MEGLSEDDNLMSNKKIKKYLQNYLDSKDAPYAVLLSGKWGCGKTYFVKSIIKSPKNILYVSLYGANSISEVKARVVESSLERKFDKKIKKGIDGLGKLASDKSIFGIPIGEMKSIASDVWMSWVNFDAVVFDDLERCEITTGEIFGYINNLLEKNKSKIIIVANEEKINHKKNDKKFKYEEIKEKLIGRTFHISHDIDSALDAFTNECNTVKEYKHLIKDAYQKTTSVNLRSLKYFVYEFEKILALAIVPPEVRKNDDALREIIENLGIFIFEMNEGKIEIEDMKPLHNRYWDSAINEKWQSFCKKYKKDYYRIFPDIGLWYEFFKYGCMDSKKLEESIDNSIYFPKEEKPMEDWKQLWYGRYFESNKEFQNCFQSVKTNLEQHEYKNSGIILHIIGIFIYLVEDNLVDETLEEISAYLIKVITSYENVAPEQWEEVEMDGSGSYAGLGYRSPSQKGNNKFQDEYKEICDHFEKVKSKILEKKRTNVATTFAQKGKEDIFSFIEEARESSRQSEYLFYFIMGTSPKDFTDEILTKISQQSRENVCRWIADNFATIGLYIQQEQNNRGLEEVNKWASEVCKLLEEKERGTEKMEAYQFGILKRFFLKDTN